MPHAGAVVLAVSSATGRGGKHGWLPDDLNNGRLDLFFLFLAGLHSHHLCADALPNVSAVVLDCFFHSRLPHMPGMLLTH